MILCYFLIIFGANNFQIINGINITAQLEDSLKFLENALQFYDTFLHQLNLDGLVGIRFSEDIISNMLDHKSYIFGNLLPRVEKVRDKMKQVSDDGIKFVEQNEPAYAADLGDAMKELKYKWYPRIATDPAYLEEPVECQYAYFNETYSDGCLKGLLHNCSVTPECKEWEETRNMREYRINHQLLFWQLRERLGCIEEAPEELRVYFCTNIFRDAKRIAKAGYPNSHQDLFSEQIGFCGPWGFYEFYQPEWIDHILSWQYPEGCLKHDGYPWHCIEEDGQKTLQTVLSDEKELVVCGVAKFSKILYENMHRDAYGQDTLRRVKREEREMDSGCLNHKTTTAFGGITAALRYQAEMTYHDLQNST